MFDIIQLMQTHTWFLLTVVGVVSLCIGSFLNVVIYRIPKMLQAQWRSECEVLLNEHDKHTTQTHAAFNLATPGSHCPKLQYQK